MASSGGTLLAPIDTNASTLGGSLTAPLTNSPVMSSGGGMSVGSYTQVPNGSGGFNYFNGNTPITVQQFNGATGQNVSAAATSAPAKSNAAPNGGAAGTAGATSSNFNASLASSYALQAQQAQDQLNDSPGGLNNALASINDAATTATNAQNQAEQNAEDDYKTSVTNDNINEGMTADQIASSTRNNGNAMQRLLGLAGSGDSSASEIAAPYLVNQQGAQAGNQADTTFGENQQALDTSIARQRQANTTDLAGISQAQVAQSQQARGTYNAQQAQDIGNLISSLGNSGYYGGAGFAPGQQTSLSAQLASATAAGNGYALTYAAPVQPTAPTTYTAPALASFASGVQAAPNTNQINTPAATAATNIATAPVLPQQKVNPLLTPVGA